MDPLPDPAPQAPPDRPGDAAPGAPRAVVWPWLVVPAVTLLVFLALRNLQHGAMRPTPATTPEAATAPDPVTPAE